MKNILLIIVVLLLADTSCRPNLSQRDAAFDVTKAEIILPKAGNRHTGAEASVPGFFFAKMPEGQSVIINYTSIGCFHSQNETVKITKTASGYNLDHSKRASGKEIRVLETKTQIPSFNHTLRTFFDNCQDVAEKGPSKKQKPELKIGTFYSLTINDGLHVFNISVNEDMNPFASLVKYIHSKKSVVSAVIN